MKNKLTIAFFLLVSTTAFAGPSDFTPAEQLSLWITSGPTLTTAWLEDAQHKNVLQMAQEDAVKFVAGNYKVAVSPALREAITTLNERVKAMNIEPLNDVQSTQMIIMLNTIPAKP